MRQSRASWQSYLFALGVAGVALLGRLALPEWLGGDAPFLAAVGLAAWLGGLGPGLLATAIGCAGALLLSPTPGSPAGAPGLLHLALFAGIGALISWLSEGLHATRRRLAATERESAHQQQELRAILESTPAAIYLIDREDRLIHISRSWQEAFGLTAEQAAGRSIDEIFPRSTADQFRENNRKVLDTGSTLEFEEIVPQGDGPHTYISVKVPIFNPGSPGAPYAVCGISTDITERKRVEREREQALTVLRSLIGSAPVGITLLDSEMRCIFANEPLAEMTGLPAGEHIGRSVAEIVPDLAATIEPMVRHVLETGEPVRDTLIEGETPNAPGVRRAWTASCFPVQDAEGGRPSSVGAVVQEVTERLSAERQLRESQEKLMAALAASDTGTFRWDPWTGVFLEFDENLKRLFGFAPGQPVRTIEDFVARAHPDDRARLLDAIDHARQGADFEMEYRVVLPDGGLRWLYDRAKMVHDADRRPLYLVGACTDVTNRRQAEDALRESERRLSTLLANLPGMAYRCPTEEPWPLTFASEGVYELTGRPPADFVEGRITWKEIMHPDDIEQVGVEVGAALQEHRIFAVVYRITRASGEERWVVDRGQPIYAEDGTPVAIEGFVGDVTEQKRAEEALKEADRRKDEFLATLAHELRNPLAPIRNGLQLIRLAGNDEATRERARTMMDRQLQQMVRLVDDLLDVSRISRGKLELRRERVELAPIVEAAVETSEPLIKGAGHTLQVTLPPEPVPLDADKTRLAQVLSNLLNNAAKYTPPGGRIRLSAERQEGQVVIRVRDNGVGIPADMLPTVFDMFTQVDRSLERSQGGLGVGLTISRRLVEMHGGTISVQSEGPGAGSELTLRLPVLATPSASEPQKAETESRAIRRKLRIVVADDNEDSAASLAMLLQLMGNDVHTVHDGMQAVETAAAIGPDVILLDIGMPRLNGYDAARRIREQPGGKDVVLIALTGWGQEEDRRRAWESGFDHHLVKPVDTAVLEKLLRPQAAESPAPDGKSLANR